MKFLFVGLGSIGQRHLRNLHALGHRDFLAYRTAKEIHAIETEYGIRRVSSYEGGLAAKPDAVFITNPTSFHVSYALRALRKGCHVFVEKPLSSAIDGVSELAVAAKDQNRILYVGYHLRFHPVLQAIKTLLDGGVLGKLIAAHIEVGEYLPDWHPGEDYRQGYAARKDLGGGVILTLSHELDYALWLFGPAHSVYCLGGSRSDLLLDVEDVAKMLIEFDSGCIADIHVDYLQRPPRRTFQLIAEKGKVEWDYFSDRAYIFWYDRAKETGELRLPAGFEKNVMYRDEVSHFIRVIKGEEQPRVPMADAVDTLRAALAAKESLASKQPVFL